MPLPRRLDTEPDQEEAVRKIQLWKMVGYDHEHGKIIFEDPKTGQRAAFWGSTWAGGKYYGPFEVKAWARDAQENQVEKVIDSYEYIDPPKHDKPKYHADTCRCNLCLPYREMEEE